MARYFTHYWKNSTWQREKECTESGFRERFLNHIADNRFVERDVEFGDSVYPVTVIEGVLYVMCKLEVSEVCDFEEAARRLGTRDLWEASDHIIAIEPVFKNFNLSVPLETSRRLRFVSGNTTKLLRFVSNTHLDKQTLRGVRELDPKSADELNMLLFTKEV